ncbi:MAG: cupin domain-containing protein, partial [Candidatus Scatosoma sp.]
MSATEYYEKEADENGHLYFEKYVLTEANPRTSFAHFHDSVEFIFVREGRYEAHVNGQSRLLFAGEFSFADSFSPHFYREAGDAVVYAVVVDKNLFTSNPFSARVFT